MALEPISTTTMLNGQKIVVVMPAYNASRAFRQTYTEVMAHGIVDLVIVVDDASQDEANSEVFVLDNQILAQIIALDCLIGEVTCPARYLPEA